MVRFHEAFRTFFASTGSLCTVSRSQKPTNNNKHRVFSLSFFIFFDVFRCVSMFFTFLQSFQRIPFQIFSIFFDFSIVFDYFSSFFDNELRLSYVFFSRDIDSEAIRSRFFSRRPLTDSFRPRLAETAQRGGDAERRASELPPH